MFLRGTEEALSTMPFEWIREWHVYPQFTVSSEGVTSLLPSESHSFTVDDSEKL